jgi:ribose transport system ATP-binding protein
MSDPVLNLKAIEKYYPGVKPLDRVDFSVQSGEIHALLGENGAGKSTLTRIIGGATKPDSGVIEYCGQVVHWRSPKQARDAGIHVIHQELALFPELTVAENILIDNQPRNALGFISTSAGIKRAEEALNRLGVAIAARARVQDLPLADQQMVEIAKALVGEVKLLILDEPTAVISGREVDLLFDNMRRLRRAGIGIVYISHRLEEIFEIADRVTILKDGRVAGVSAVRDLTRESMISMMVGRRLEQIFPARPATPSVGQVVLQVNRLRAGPRVKDVSLSVRAGEIVGVAGMVGSGRTEIAQAIFGDRSIEAGEISIGDSPQRLDGPRSAIALGLGYLTESRKDEGLFLGMSVAANIVAPMLGAVTKYGLLQARMEQTIAKEQIAAFSVATPSCGTRVHNLSGGNQQKVLFSRWSRIASRLLILDEPTRGVDVGAKVEIYRLIRELADKGIAVLMISSELPEVVGLSDRVIVVAQGRVVGELEGPAISEESIMNYAVVSTERGADLARGPKEITA